MGKKSTFAGGFFVAHLGKRRRRRRKGLVGVRFSRPPLKMGETVATAGGEEEKNIYSCSSRSLKKKHSCYLFSSFKSPFKIQAGKYFPIACFFPHTNHACTYSNVPPFSRFRLVWAHISVAIYLRMVNWRRPPVSLFWGVGLQPPLLKKPTPSLHFLLSSVPQGLPKGGPEEEKQGQRCKTFRCQNVIFLFIYLSLCLLSRSS